MRWIAITLAVICVALSLMLNVAAGSSTPPAATYNGITLKREQGIAVNVIRKVFGRYANQALSVSYCESRFWVWASNGQYKGLFQMGESERETYGHSYNNAWVQARAALRYFVDSGRDWSPWASICRPW